MISIDIIHHLNFTRDGFCYIFSTKNIYIFVVDRLISVLLCQR